VKSPSAWPRRVVVVVLAAIDFVLATHMALYQWRLIDAVWDPVFGPEQSHLVLDSAVSEASGRVLRIPDAALGAAAYLVEVVLGLIGSQQRWRQRPWLVVLFGANALAVALVGLALVVLQATVVDAWCLLCLITAAFSVVMFVLALTEVRASLGHFRQKRQRTRESMGRLTVRHMPPR
jgi:uncharacterized membrane protein